MRAIDLFAIDTTDNESGLPQKRVLQPPFFAETEEYGGVSSLGYRGDDSYASDGQTGWY